MAVNSARGNESVKVEFLAVFSGVHSTEKFFVLKEFAVSNILGDFRQILIDVKTECDCSALVRQCIKEATAVDPSNFTTENETSVLKRTGLFHAPIKYKSGTPLYNGDILVTCSRGHTAVVVSALPRIEQSNANSNYFPQYFGKDTSIVNALISVGANASKDNRKKIAAANGIQNYTGTANENLWLLSLLKKGLLIKP